MHAVMLTGSGRYSDPWHPYTETSPRLTELAEAAGFAVTAATDIDTALADLPDDVQLLIVNAGDPAGPAAEEAGPGEETADVALIARANAALEAAIERGIGILAVHAAAASLRDYPAYERALGARWERERSWHPPIGDAHVHVVGNHAIAEGLGDFTVFDERYTDFRLDAVIEPIAEHEHDGTRHPLVWAREFGRSRLVYDALGHDARSYDSAGHCELLERSLAWLGRVPAPTANQR
ncbi:ThuA domain-containing protein [Agromyces subbeticus]|uniref:ThuA domain-containing protein n=1 Tax=Agromyces subbeticus TaxID=293890 RepID=UPI0003B3B400|nr:ThuA domain-containing protein [Agromyces subbeticus]